MVEGNLKAVMSFWRNAGKPLGNIPFASLVVKGLLKTMESEERVCLPFEPEVVQVLLKNALSVQGPTDFVSLRQAALYCAMYWGTARFKEVIDLEIQQILKKRSFY